MKVAVFGATGVLGRHVLPRLLERGHEVTAVVRPEGRRPSVVHERLATLPGSILDERSCTAASSGADVVLHLATAIPAPGAGGDWSLNDRIRRVGTAQLLSAASANRVRLCVLQSVVMLTSDASGALLDEDAPVSPSPVTQSALDLEAQAKQAGLPTLVLRGGLFYGTGTARMEAWNRDARAGRLVCPGDGDAFVSLVHVVDMARAVVAAAEADVSGVLNVVDDAPVTYRELFTHIARLCGQTAPATGGPPPPFPAFNVSNRRARQVLGWAPAYPSHLSGWQS